MKKQIKGYLLFEILIAIVIFGIIVGAVFPTLDFMLKKHRNINTDVYSENYILDGLEIAYNVFLDSANWNLVDGIYRSRKIISNPPEKKWSLDLINNPSQWEELGDGYRRRIELMPLCRDLVTGEQITCDGSLTGLDSNSRLVKSTLQWTENGINKESSNTITVYKF